MKTTRRLMILALVALPLMAGCSGNRKSGGENAADTDSAWIREAEEAADSVTLPSLTAEGIGPVRVGMPTDSLPQGVDGLYDRMVMDQDGEFPVISFMLGEKEMFQAYVMDDGKVDLISVETPGIGVNTPGGTLQVGDKMSTLLKERGVSTEFASADDSGLWYWKYRGLWFSPDPEQCSPALIEAMSSRRNPPAAGLVDDKTTIGFIATGLPF